MEQSKDLKAIAEEVIKEAIKKKEIKRKPIHDLYEQLKFFNSMGVCAIHEHESFIEVRFYSRFYCLLWNITITDTPYKYRIIYPNGRNAKTECNSIEQLVRLIANFSVTKDFVIAAKVAGCEHVERDEY